MPTARLLLPLAMWLLVSGCQWFSPRTSAKIAPAPAVEPLAPSSRLILGRLVAVDPSQHFAFVELAADAPANALSEGTELIVRTSELRETGRLRASRYLRGRTLGTTILNGQPALGDEVVWLAP
jgi:hypothetical protein